MSESGSSKETREERRQRLHREARDAAQILNHPKVQGFFEERRKRTWQAFRKLPMQASREEFQALHSYAEALDSLEADLRRHIESYDRMVQQEDWLSETGGYDPQDG